MFYKKVELPLSQNNKSKNQLIVLKFGTDVAFLYLQSEFVDQKKILEINSTIRYVHGRLHGEKLAPERSEITNVILVHFYTGAESD